MPVHKTRKRYILIKWHEQSTPLNRYDLEKLLGAVKSDASAALRPQSSLMILDQARHICIVKTTHTQLEGVKIQLTRDQNVDRMPKFQVLSVSGSIKKLKEKLASIK